MLGDATGIAFGMLGQWKTTAVQDRCAAKHSRCLNKDEMTRPHTRECDPYILAGMQQPEHE